MADFADLTSTLRKTRGQIPPPLVGSSVTLVNDRIWVFGGRPVESRTMVSTLYSLDLRTLEWTRVESTGPAHPSPRYFHTAEAWGDKALVVFGGQSFVENTTGSGVQGGPLAGTGHLETLDELWLFDLDKMEWTFPVTTNRPGAAPPKPRYAHLSVVSTVSSEPPIPGFEDSAPAPSTASRLVVIGGQDFQNNYIAEMSVLDLDKMEWLAHAPYPRRAGSYRSVASTSKTSLAPLETKAGADGYSVYSSYSFPSTEDAPEPVFVFTNTNFTNPRRDLDLVSAPIESFTTPSYLSLADRMTGLPSLPPGLRFPRLYSCGSRSLVLSGADVREDHAEYATWTLDLGERGGSGTLRSDERLIWKRIPVDRLLSRGSWGPAVGWRNTLVVLGDKDRDMLQDYQSRQNNFAQVVLVDLESFGIYEPPPQPLPPTAQTLGLLSLSQPRLFDFEIICNDRERLGCSRSILEDRWPWFASEIKSVASKRSTPADTTLDILGEYDDASDDEPIDVLQAQVSPPTTRPSTSMSMPRSPPARPASKRLFSITAHTLELPLSSQEVKALIQYFYTLALSTPLQRSIPILASLLNFEKTYNILPNLRTLIVHALHESLESDLGNAAKIYEAAAMCRCMALQIAAMQVMIARNSGTDSPLNRSRENSIVFVDGSERMLHRYSNSSHPSGSSRYSIHSDPDSENRFPRSPSVSPQVRSIATFNGETQPSLATPAPTTALPPPPPPTFPSRTASRNVSIDNTSIVSGLPGSPSMHFPQPPNRKLVSPVPSMSPPLVPSPPATTPSPASSQAATPARIAEAWREGEERDRRQRLEQARLEAEANFARLRIAQRNGSVATTSSSLSGGYYDAQSRRPSTTPSLTPSGVAFSHSTTESVTNYQRDTDATSVRTDSSGADSGFTQLSSEKAGKAAAASATAVGKVIKKGLWAGLLAQPEFHQTAAAPVATGPPARKVYPAPRPRYPTKGKKGTASDSNSSHSK
ncbi:uncharacterized protein JCM15063_000277 [Sporobolomyces koalae]|uniref:uncharacterized protein n=1 Tax=Sporobolomyces koalae TaxID=500713 RepID=UPI003177A7A6